MWAVGHDDSDGNRIEVAWFLYKHDAVAALRDFTWHYTVETATDPS